MPPTKEDDMTQNIHETNTEERRDIPVNRIITGRYQFREAFDQEDIEYFAESLRQKGMLDPIEVRTADDQEGYFELIDGERRLRSAISANWSTVPAIIKYVSQGEALEIAVVRNVQRKNFGPIETAKAIAKLVEHYQGNRSAVGRIIGKSSVFVEERLQLLKLSEAIQKMIAAGEINIACAKIIMEINPEQQLNAATIAVKERLPAHRLLARMQRHVRRQTEKRQLVITFEKLRGFIAATFEGLEHFDIPSSNAMQRETLVAILQLLKQKIETVETELKTHKKS
ncbi:MAG: hypothetical protein A3B74_00755 [Candidatus Kerfeldbacteria bacterium RIFCSPHIGHO2_02_FULL_42_14]|uniref:ParB-like N-terminal domain-containing protein n=1 Tax=Candidatus Kerfeldbacteria bacterium RIFCSPHIGHO2_02_FULL_42_14 TaxID=1798540 RepID=A0A1G2AS51_9BACT|nr:MAG: hypothetical protein A3B74_00755 [Candidatus Kerfeldbacteria bacterium RIFCSPHIGHO2_02_FULL_42_14]OGY81887.1 MAG: hypothetical protein A3E60_00835 [Candidatus Kerfeldbacteria bacterium RIFCSPHIGHO2_12_FULL_42_13]OGY83478.1 MAG: hypothetical protein A3I91_02420 [Candidatus Kerfeldbacteria bacterium RIFCSPLOWO2_02_FULL_42_19]OGY86996.1 MAG: hypothetical protein A3G01_01790 [Candidatus Kerfeldbacteria bacterium RIFCSPLOWO2_12_FULL_43_9]